MDPLYRAVRSLVRFWIWFLLKSVEVRHPERVPSRGAVLLAINHPNNLIDSLLVGAVVPRKVHYLAAAALFRNHLLAGFLRIMGVIPVHRRQDDPDKMEQNVAAFEACARALGEGKLIAIYPEGTTHAEPRVQRIKTGAARIVLETLAKSPDLDLALIPVGLNFEQRKSFRSRVLVAFGEPIPLAGALSRSREDPWRAVDQLTDAIQVGMEAQVIHVARIDLADLIRQVERLYRGDLIQELQRERGYSQAEIDTFRLSRTIVAAVHHFKEREPERVERLWQQIQRYQALLAEYRLRDQAVQARLGNWSLRRAMGISGLGLLGIPVLTYGAIVNGLPYGLPRWLARRLTRKETDYATTRLLSSILLFPLFWGLETWIVWRWTSAWIAALFAASLPLSGLWAYRSLATLGRLRQQLRFTYLSVTRNQSARQLLVLRKEILDELERAKNDYLGATRRVPA